MYPNPWDTCFPGIGGGACKCFISYNYRHDLNSCSAMLIIYFQDPVNSPSMTNAKIITSQNMMEISCTTSIAAAFCHNTACHQRRQRQVVTTPQRRSYDDVQDTIERSIHVQQSLGCIIYDCRFDQKAQLINDQSFTLDLINYSVVFYTCTHC